MTFSTVKKVVKRCQKIKLLHYFDRYPLVSLKKESNLIKIYYSPVQK
jgi:hypothetical protein